MPLSTSVITALARNFLPSMVSRGLSSNLIISQLRDLGLGYRRSNMLTDIRHFTGLAKRQAAAQATSSSVLFPRGAMVETNLGKARKYRVYAQITIENQFTKAQEKTFISMYTNTRDSKEGWLDDMLNKFPDQESGIGFNVIDAEIVSVEHFQVLDY